MSLLPVKVRSINAWDYTNLRGYLHLSFKTSGPKNSKNILYLLWTAIVIYISPLKLLAAYS